METNKNRSEKDQQNTNKNAYSAYSGSGSMQPGAGTGEAGRLNDYQKDYLDDASEKKTILREKALPRPLTLRNSRIFNS